MYEEEEKHQLQYGHWHAHFYSKPPARPTPHCVEDILELKKPSRCEQSRERVLNEEVIVLEQRRITEKEQDERSNVHQDRDTCIRKAKTHHKDKAKATMKLCEVRGLFNIWS